MVSILIAMAGRQRTYISLKFFRFFPFKHIIDNKIPVLVPLTSSFNTSCYMKRTFLSLREKKNEENITLLLLLWMWHIGLWIVERKSVKYIKSNRNEGTQKNKMIAININFFGIKTNVGTNIETRKNCPVSFRIEKGQTERKQKENSTLTTTTNGKRCWAK